MSLGAGNGAHDQACGLGLLDRQLLSLNLPACGHQACGVPPVCCGGHIHWPQMLLRPTQQPDPRRPVERTTVLSVNTKNQSILHKNDGFERLNLKEEQPCYASAIQTRKILLL
jgi:hypothetical protein